MKSPVSFVAAVLIFSMPLLLPAADPASAADKTFVGKVSQGGQYEVDASKLAAERASAPDVKDQALTEIHDHTLVNTNLKKVATATGVAIAPQRNSEFQQRYDKLKATAAADFDQAYLADMKDIHDKDEKLFAQEATEGSSGYKTFAHQTDQIVKRHIGALNAPGTM